jgi:hypothetical protein
MPHNNRNSHSWQADLTVTNVPDVVARLREMLDGKQYTHILCLQLFAYKPDVETGQVLEGGRVAGGSDAKFGSGDNIQAYNGYFVVNDTHGVRSFKTDLRDGQDPEKRTTHFWFDGPGKVTIWSLTDVGQIRWDVYCVEGPIKPEQEIERERVAEERVDRLMKPDGGGKHA